MFIETVVIGMASSGGAACTVVAIRQVPWFERKVGLGNTPIRSGAFSICVIELTFGQSLRTQSASTLPFRSAKIGNGKSTRTTSPQRHRRDMFIVCTSPNTQAPLGATWIDLPGVTGV